jgi:hypothetical protein|tara:strand:+ start:475 stop:1425 length:951 start_codon:yes stop_codon:yes gene_type:complete
MLKKITQLTLLFLLLSFISISVAQEVSIDNDGTEITVYEDIISFYDPFTDVLTIRSKSFNISYQASSGEKFRIMPVFSGTKECNQELCGDFFIRVILEGSSIADYFGMTNRNLLEEFFLSSYPILFDEVRDNVSISLISNDNMGKMLMNNVTEYSSSTAMDIDLEKRQYYLLKKSSSTKVRIEGTVIEFGEEVKNHFSKIEKMLFEAYAQNTNELNITNIDDSQSAPYELKWEGNIQRDPLVQPLPQNTTNAEGVISVRFQVKPDGSVGMIIPLKKMNEELEKEVQRTLRSWQFSKLPSGTPQQAQWGTITFRFVF